MFAIELQRPTKSDIATLIGWVDSPQFLLQWAGPIFTYPLDESQVEKHLLEADGAEPILMPFKVVDAASQKMVGYVELANIDRRNRSAVLSRVLVGPSHLRGRGIGAQMVREVLRIGFEELSLHRIDLLVFDFNRRAIACYEGVGFQREGLLRECRKIGDEYWSVYVMSILEHEWKGRRVDDVTNRLA